MKTPVALALLLVGCSNPQDFREQWISLENFTATEVEVVGVNPDNNARVYRGWLPAGARTCTAMEFAPHIRVTAGTRETTFRASDETHWRVVVTATGIDIMPQAGANCP